MLSSQHRVPHRSLPSRTEVDLWTVRLESDDAELEACMHALAPDERKRAARFRFDRHRRAFVIAHAALRHILASYMKTSAEELTFKRNSFGKPDLAPPFDTTSLRFNLSHTPTLALVAVTNAQEIGVDVECLERKIGDLENIAKRFFTHAERDALLKLSEQERPNAFLRLWTRKEAFIKMLGTGLSRSLSSFSVSFDENTAQALLHVDGDAAAATKWTVTGANPSEKYEAAIAIEGALKRIRTCLWPSSRDYVSSS